jgi:hypothetical protein
MGLTDMGSVDLRDARLPQDLAAVERLWLEYLTWGNDEMESRHGFRLPVREAVDHDLAAIDAYEPPHGRILLAFDGEHAYGIGCLRRIGDDTAEIKRMYVVVGGRGSRSAVSRPAATSARRLPRLRVPRGLQACRS